MTQQKKHLLDIKSDKSNPNVRSASIRKLGKDGTSFTPTEKHKRDRLMKQFSNQQKGYGTRAITPEYAAGYDAIDWTKK